MDIFIFDDHQMMRSGLKICFSDSKLYTIAGEAVGYVSKNSETKVLLDAVAAASKGITFIDPYLSGLTPGGKAFPPHYSR
ncbi:MAG: hypothetical protein K5907_03080 [Treponema sp.]|nr:hypothetical protein [Treponema sp.]